jgi:penicillin amidase
MSTQQRGFRKWLWRGLLGLLLLSAAAPLTGWLLLRGSLAKLDGSVVADGLSAQVTVERDALGIPTVRGQSRLDVAYTTGYLHAQDRFFQMDLLRRVAAGELAELFGAKALRIDRQRRLHRFRARAKAILSHSPPEDRALLSRYVHGVNDGLSALSVRPFEYGLLRTTPSPWQEEDCLLVVWAMYFDLQGNLQSRELARGHLREHSTKEQLAFLLPTVSKVGCAARLSARFCDDNRDTDGDSQCGSGVVWCARAWAADVSAGTRFAPRLGATTGRYQECAVSMVARWLLTTCTWESACHIFGIDYSLIYTGDDGQPRRIGGVSLPGAPAVVVGSTGKVAWGFTNSYGDYLDLIALERDSQSPLRVKTESGWETAQSYQETLRVKDAKSEVLTVTETSLGPIWEVAGRSYAIHWMAHDPHAVNLGLIKMENAHDLTSAQAVAHQAGVPAQNMVAGDSQGHIGWTIAGPLPNRRASEAATFPLRVTELAQSFQGVRPGAEYPQVNDPPSGQLWTANARQLVGPQYELLGDGGADLGARAQQIRDALTRLGHKQPEKTDERAVYQLGLDDRALFVDGWRTRALAALDDASVSGHPERAEFRRLLQSSWDGHASVDSVGYRLAKGFLNALYEELFGGIDQELGRLAPGADFDSANPRWPAVVARLLDERPAGWIPSGRRDFHEVELAAIDRVIAQLTKAGTPLAKATWGAQNTARIEHPFASVVSVPKALVGGSS